MTKKSTILKTRQERQSQAKLQSIWNNMDIKVEKDDSNLRFDKFLRKLLVNAPLAFIFKGIRQGKFLVNNKKAEQSYRLKESDSISIDIPKEEYEKLISKEVKRYEVNQLRFKILYEDDDLLIVDKPAFLASHSGTSEMRDNLIDEVRFYLKDKQNRSSLANRLDKETSGIVLIAKNKQALRKLNNDIKERKVKKYYLALVSGKIKNKSGTLIFNLERFDKKFETKIQVSEEGKYSETKYKVLKEFNDFTLLELELITGRMHQIRVHLQELGNPIIGDKLYGDEDINKKFKLNRQFLHAYKVIFNHPVTGKLIEIESKLPEELNKLLKTF
ncbi:MAG TPA: RluA family pseudouridine synthase [Candidatus Nanoarchaeia archaeon]|nr:RluA family pseudouridine synthase [Candidatus Nanoarchaeia archaeon]